jgi:hypothetical protein
MLTPEPRKLEASSRPKPRHPEHVPRPGVPASPDPDAPLLTRRVGIAPQPGRPPEDDPYRQQENEMTADTSQRTDHIGTRRFSEGIEQLPDTRDKQLTGRFSCGLERSPSSPEKRVTRRFSHGIEQLPDTPQKRALGRFSRGIEHHVQRAR